MQEPCVAMRQIMEGALEKFGRRSGGGHRVLRRRRRSSRKRREVGADDGTGRGRGNEHRDGGLPNAVQRLPNTPWASGPITTRACTKC